MSKTKSFEEKQEEARKKAQEAKLKLITPPKKEEEDELGMEKEVSDNVIVTEEGREIDSETGEILEESTGQQESQTTEIEDGQQLETKKVKTTDDILKEAFKAYIDQLQRDKIDDRAVRTTIHIDKDVSEMLDEICYKKQGLKTKIINTAIRSIVESGQAEKMGKAFDKAKKLKESYNKKYFNRLLDDLEIEQLLMEEEKAGS